MFSVVTRAIDASVDLLGGVDEDGLRSAIAITHSGLIRSLRRHLGAADSAVPNLGGVWVGLGDDGLHLGPLFTFDGLVASGVDGPGEDPGEKADEARDRGRAERGLTG